MVVGIERRMLMLIIAVVVAAADEGGGNVCMHCAIINSWTHLKMRSILFALGVLGPHFRQVWVDWLQMQMTKLKWATSLSFAGWSSSAPSVEGKSRSCGFSASWEASKTRIPSEMDDHLWCCVIVKRSCAYVVGNREKKTKCIKMSKIGTPSTLALLIIMIMIITLRLGELLLLFPLRL